MENKKTNTLIHSSEPRYGEGHIFLWWENYCRRLLYADILYVEGSGSYSEFHAIVKIGDRWFPIGRAYRPRLLQVLHFPELPRQNSKQEL